MNSFAAAFSDDGKFSLSALALPKADALVMLSRGLLDNLLPLLESKLPTVEFVMRSSGSALAM